jgi:hypothetical protein
LIRVFEVYRLGSEQVGHRAEATGVSRARLPLATAPLGKRVGGCSFAVETRATRAKPQADVP